MSVARRRRGSSKSEDTPSATDISTSTSSISSGKFLLEENKENMGRDRTGEFQSALRSLQGTYAFKNVETKYLNRTTFIYFMCIKYKYYKF